MSVAIVEADTLGEAWLRVSRAILDGGEPATWGPLATVELARLTVAVARPDPEDPLIAELGDPEWLAWMEANFGDRRDVGDLGGARSYAAISDMPTMTS